MQKTSFLFGYGREDCEKTFFSLTFVSVSKARKDDGK